jgi:cell division protein FtsL
MSRLNAFILVVLMLSSLYLVKVAYETRSLFVALDRSQTEERTLETDFEKLQVEKRAQATPLRVEKMAREKLGMLPANPAVTQYLEYAPAASAPKADEGMSTDGLPLRPGEEAANRAIEAAGSRLAASKAEGAR